MGDFIWIFFILITLQPLLQKRLLEASRARMIAKIEKERGSRVILLVHRQETMGFLGFPILRYIDVNDSEAIMRACQLTDPDVPIDLVLHTPGGLVFAAVQIARAIRAHPGKVTVFVPHHAMSGGTLIALASDEIVMSKHAVLGPVDPQLGTSPAASLLKVVEQKPIAKIDDATLILADQAGKAIKQVHANVVELLPASMSPEKREELASMLSEGRWTHDHAITAQMAKDFGFNVNTDMPEEVLALMNMFPQPTRQEATVEFLPTPRHSDKPASH